MATNLTKLNIDNKIALSFYKNRGDVSAVCKEVKDVDPSYIVKVMNKMRSKLQRDVAYFLSVSIGGAIWSGIQQRTAHLTECLSKLRDSEEVEVEVSTCCNVPVRYVVEQGESHPYCLRCGEKARLHTIKRNQVLNLVLSFIRELREEDKFSLDFAEKMGFTLKESLPPPPVFKQNILVVGDDRVVFSGDDKQILEELDKIGPQERQRARRVLEKKMIEGGVQEPIRRKLKLNQERRTR